MLSKILKPGMKGLFYGRYSTHHQDINRQKQMAKDIVKEFDCEIVNFNYVDKGISARKNSIKERKFLNKLINELDDFMYDFIIVSEEDRLARKAIEHQLLRTTFLIANVPVVICRTKSLYNSKEKDVLVQLIGDGISQYEVANIRTNTRNGIKARIKSGLWAGGQPVFGYTYDKETGQFSTYEEELIIVKKIYDLYKKGLGFKCIANQISLEFKKENPFTRDKVKSIVTSPFYAGYLSWGKRSGNAKNSINPDRDAWIFIKTDAIEPVIDINEWEYCWKLYTDKREKKLPPKHYNTRFLLKDLVHCKHCRQPLETKNQSTSNNEKSYGNSIYRCQSCGVRCEAEDLHGNVINNTLNDIILTDKAVVLENLQNKFKDDIQAKEADIENLRKAVGKYSNQINDIKFKLEELMQDTRDQKDRDIIKIVSLLRLELKNRLDNTLHLINQKTKEIKVLQEIDCNEDRLLKLIAAAHSNINEMANYELRQLLMHFIKIVEVDKDNKITFINRVNLKKQGNPQIQLYLH